MNKINSVSHIWSLISSYSVLDQESNNLSLFNLIEKISVNVPEAEMLKLQKEGANKGFMFPFNFEVISRFLKNQGNQIAAFDLRVRMVNPDGKSLSTAEQKIALNKDIRNMRVRTRFGSIFLDKAGDYSIAIDIKDVEDTRYVEVSRIPLEVMINIKRAKA